MILLAVFAGVTAFGLAHGLGWFAVAIGAAVAGVYYRFDIWRRPYVPCRTCRGTGANYSRLGRSESQRPFGNCWCCKGSKAHPRFASRILAPAQYQAVRSGRSGRNYG
jgi:hypothetical protein